MATGRGTDAIDDNPSIGRPRRALVVCVALLAISAWKWKVSGPEGNIADPVGDGPRENNVNDTQSFPSETFTYEPTKFWDALDLTNEDFRCGNYKCLFRTKAVAQGGGDDDQQVAYLVGNNFLGYQYELESEMTWQLALHLESSFRVKHLYLGPPGKVMILPTAFQVFQDRTLRKGRQIYAPGDFAVVQKVRLAPEPNAIVMSRTWTKFASLYRNHVEKRSEFREAIRKNAGPALAALEVFPLLAMDYQVLVDVDGNIYQFDLDRVFLGRVYKQQKFEEKFAKAYRHSTSLLRKLTSWASSHDGKEEDEVEVASGEGEAVLAAYLQNTSSLSCQALKTVNSMSGRIGEEGNVTRPAKVMMVKLVQNMQVGADSNEERSGRWNCSL